MSSLRATSPKESLRQAMSWLHTWAGLIFGWLLYAMFLTGTLAFFRAEITQWMQPEIQVQRASIEHSVGLAQQYLSEHAPAATRWFITPPSARQPVLRVSYPPINPKPGARRFTEVKLDPVSGAPLEARATRGGDFFYRFHFELGMGFPWGRWLACIAAMFMLVAIVSGVITHKKIFTDFFTFRPKKGGQRAWMDGHNVLSVLGLPFHLMITFSGLVIFMNMLMPAGILGVYDDTRDFNKAISPASITSVASKTPAPLIPIAPLVAQAQTHWPGGSVGRIVVNHPGDAAATVTLIRSSSDSVSFGRSSPQLVFNGVSGELQATAQNDSAVMLTTGGIVGLHLGLFAEPLLRWMYFLVSLAGTAMVGTGLILWIAKRRKKENERDTFSLRLVDALNAGTIAGLSIAVAVYFWANRLLPVALQDRALWETQLFFLSWAAAFIYAAVFPTRMWAQLLGLASALFAVLPLVNVFTTERHLGYSLAQGDWLMAGFDLSLLAGAALLAWMAYKAHRAKRKTGAAPRRAARAKNDADSARSPIASSSIDSSFIR